MPKPSGAAAAQAYAVAIKDVATIRGDYFFRYDEFGTNSEAPPHSHEWGHLNYAAHGSMHMDVPTGRLLCPPQHAVWIPPHVVHSCYLPHAIEYRALYLAPELCELLPTQAGCLRLTAIVKAIFADFALRDVHEPGTDADLRMARVCMTSCAPHRWKTVFCPPGKTRPWCRCCMPCRPTRQITAAWRTGPPPCT